MQGGTISRGALEGQHLSRSDVAVATELYVVSCEEVRDVCHRGSDALRGFCLFWLAHL